MYVSNVHKDRNRPVTQCHNMSRFFSVRNSSEVDHLKKTFKEAQTDQSLHGELEENDTGKKSCKEPENKQELCWSSRRVPCSAVLLLCTEITPMWKINFIRDLGSKVDLAVGLFYWKFSPCSATQVWGGYSKMYILKPELWGCCMGLFDNEVTLVLFHFSLHSDQSHSLFQSGNNTVLLFQYCNIADTAMKNGLNILPIKI